MCLPAVLCHIRHVHLVMSMRLKIGTFEKERLCCALSSIRAGRDWWASS